MREYYYYTRILINHSMLVVHKSHQKKMLNAQIIMFRGARIFIIIFLLNSYFHVDQFLFLYVILHYFMYFFRHICHFFIQHTPVYSYAVNREQFNY